METFDLPGLPIKGWENNDCFLISLPGSRLVAIKIKPI